MRKQNRIDLFQGISVQLASQTSSVQGSPTWTLEYKPLPVKDSQAAKVTKAVANGIGMALLVGQLVWRCLKVAVVAECLMSGSWL
jgi:hypothetical protein